ncbi:hypothetical protein NW765_002100 [Fusarium oxysporum]|nr:hypothetical protein NW765_002100 [Fusarium oxysporum]
MSVTLHTSHGDIKVEIYCESVPKTAENFLALCGSGYYDKSPFHRLIPKFMAQTGAPATPNPPITPKADAAYGEARLKTRSGQRYDTALEACCRWPTRDLGQTDRNSLSHSTRRRIWTDSTLYLDASSETRV